MPTGGGKTLRVAILGVRVTVSMDIKSNSYYKESRILMNRDSGPGVPHLTRILTRGMSPSVDVFRRSRVATMLASKYQRALGELRQGWLWALTTAASRPGRTRWGRGGSLAHTSTSSGSLPRCTGHRGGA